VLFDSCIISRTGLHFKRFATVVYHELESHWRSMAMAVARFDCLHSRKAYCSTMHVLPCCHNINICSCNRTLQALDFTTNRVLVKLLETSKGWLENEGLDNDGVENDGRNLLDVMSVLSKCCAVIKEQSFLHRVRYRNCRQALS